MRRNTLRLPELPGDGIDPEVIAGARRVLDWFVAHRGVGVEVAEGEIGYAAYLKSGTLLSEETMQEASRADAILFGAVDGPEFEALPSEIRRKVVG